MRRRPVIAHDEKRIGERRPGSVVSPRVDAVSRGSESLPDDEEVAGPVDGNRRRVLIVQRVHLKLWALGMAGGVVPLRDDVSVSERGIRARPRDDRVSKWQ